MIQDRLHVEGESLFENVHVPVGKRLVYNSRTSTNTLTVVAGCVFFAFSHAKVDLLMRRRTQCQVVMYD